MIFLFRKFELPNFSHFSMCGYGRNIVITKGKFCDLQEPLLQTSVANREIAEVINKFTCKVSSLV